MLLVWEPGGSWFQAKSVFGIYGREAALLQTFFKCF